MWLTVIKGLTPKKVYDILNDFSDARAIFYATPEKLNKLSYLSDINIKSIINSQNENLINELEKKLYDNNIEFISLEHPDYPELLKEIYDPPVGLYVIGKLPDDNIPKVSIIGSRRCTEYGTAVSKRLGLALAENNVVVVSGMARGIDSMAHRGAIDGGGLTVAVLGCGVDVCYPPENAALRQDIIKNGCVVSEFPPGTGPSKFNFPQRNRIVSGLSLGIVVVEAAQQSGTSLTVDYATDQGREVMAVPGNITNKYSFGTNKLIFEGATMVAEAEDILNSLGLESSKNKNIKNSKNYKVKLAPEEKLVYDIIDFGPVGFDELVIRLNSQAQTVNVLLTMLEIKGLIQKLPGQRFVRLD